MPDMSNGIDFDTESGISIEDQKEIIAQIENTVSERRISIDDELLTIKPKKRGILFPILINAILILLTAAVVFGLQWFFSRQEQQLELDARIYSGGDSLLINQFKKEVNAKEKEISMIQERLQNLDDEKSKLQETMDSQIEQKQLELEEQMRLELENERQRLKDEGISTEDIDTQIEEIKRQKELENKQELEAFQKKAEEQKLADEKRIEEMKNEFTTSLDSLNSEKATLEKELAYAEEKEAALEKEKTEAEKKLKEMSEQREKEERLNEQIRGMYENINIQMQDGKYEAAMNSLEEMRRFFYDETTAILPSILKRREVELFLIGSLENLIQEELTKADIDTATLLEKANLITSISAKANEAEKRYQQKDYAGAQQLYKEALAILPDIEKSYTTLSSIDTSQKNQLFSDYYKQAETFYTNFKYSDAIESYRKAIKLFPQDKARVDTMITRIMEAGYRLQGDMSAVVEDEKNANQLLSKASQALRDKDYNKAIDCYVEILTKYSRTTQVNSARNGINTSVTREREAFIEEMDAVIAEKDQLIAEKDAMIAEMDKTDILSSITEKAKEADNQYKNKNYDEAIALYEETLGIIPEVVKSHNTIIFIEDNKKNELFIRYCSEAETSYSNSDYKIAIENYTKAIKLFPQNQSLVDAMVLRIMESGYKLQGDPEVIAEEEKKANELLIKASRELKAKNYETALDSYIDILSQYPRTSRASSAQNGIRTTIKWEKEAIIAEKDSSIGNLETTISKKDTTIGNLESTINEKDSEIASLNKIKEDFTKKIAQLEKDKQELEAELAALREQVEQGTATSGATISPTPEPTPPPTPVPTQEPTKAPGTDITLGDDEVIITKEEMEEYNKLKQQITDLKDQYIQYTQEEDRIIAEQGSVGYLKTKTLLGDLLHSEFAREIFPDLYERLKKFDDALAEDARADGQYLAVDNILNIIYDRMILDSEEEISQYWKGLRDTYKDDSLFLELLDELEDMMEE